MKRWNLDKTRTYLYAIAIFSGLGYNINFNKATNTLFANLTVHSDILTGATPQPTPTTLVLAILQRRPISQPI